jgi:hypothetical protein
MIARALAGLLRLGARVTVAIVAYDLARTMLIPPAANHSFGPTTVAVLAQLAGGLLAGAITILVGKFLYDTFLPISRST